MDPSDPVLIHVSVGTVNQRTNPVPQGISRSRRKDDLPSHPPSSFSFPLLLSNPKATCSPLHSAVDAVEHTFDDTESATTSFKTRFSDAHLIPPTAERQQQNFGWVAHRSWDLGGEHSTASTRDPSQWPRQEYLSAGTANESGNASHKDELNQFIQKHSVYATCSLTDTRH
jgi:hypothetical protein